MIDALAAWFTDNSVKVAMFTVAGCFLLALENRRQAKQITALFERVYDLEELAEPDL